jgi:hypothetical protein
MQPQQMNQPGFGGEMPGQAMDPMPINPGMPNQDPGFQQIMPDKNPGHPNIITPDNPNSPDPVVLQPQTPNVNTDMPKPPAAPETPNGLDAFAAANNKNEGMDKMPPAPGTMDFNAAPNMPNNNEIIDEVETRNGAAKWAKDQDPQTLQITMEEIQKKLGQQPGQPGMEAYKQTM